MFQQLIIVGNVGRPPEQRFTPSGKAVSKFSLAVNEGGGDTKRTTWFEVTAWEKLAEIVAEHVVKGQLVMVVGRIEPVRIYTDKEGNQRASLEVTAQTVKFLGKRDGATASDSLHVDVANSEELPF